jgi:hypothetical protein
MPAISRSRRSAAGVTFIVAGALLLLAVLLGLVPGVTFVPWLRVLALLAIGVGFLILAIGSVANLIARIALIVGAVGWLLLGLAGAGLALPEPLGLIAAVLAALGGVVGSIVLYTGKEITDRSAIVFIITTLVSAIYLLVPMGNATIATFITLVFAAGLVLTGVFFHWVQRGRR